MCNSAYAEKFPKYYAARKVLSVKFLACGNCVCNSTWYSYLLSFGMHTITTGNEVAGKQYIETRGIQSSVAQNDQQYDIKLLIATLGGKHGH